MAEFSSIENLTEKEQAYENFFLNILQQEGKIEPFIDHVFKFLIRRTDFFMVQESSNQNYGFPPGYAKKVVQKTFEKYDNIPKDFLKKKLMNNEVDNSLKSNQTDKTSKPDTINKLKPTLDNSKIENSSLPLPTSSVPKDKPKTSSELKIDPSDKDSLKKQQEMFQKNPSSYNGAIRDGYTWSQGIKELDVRVNISSKIKSSKEVKVKIEKDSLQVSAKDESNTWNYLINDSLAWKIKPDECTWSLFPGDHIHIYLEKSEERWWERLLEKEEKLDLKNMNPEKPMDDLEEEAQAKIRQMMYDQHQKRLGLPTSEQQSYNEILKKAWNIEGSPFKGTPFDPSVIKTPADSNSMNLEEEN